MKDGNYPTIGTALSLKLKVPNLSLLYIRSFVCLIWLCLIFKTTFASWLDCWTMNITSFKVIQLLTTVIFAVSGMRIQIHLRPEQRLRRFGTLWTHSSKCATIKGHRVFSEVPVADIIQRLDLIELTFHIGTVLWGSSLEYPMTSTRLHSLLSAVIGTSNNPDATDAFRLRAVWKSLQWR